MLTENADPASAEGGRPTLFRGESNTNECTVFAGVGLPGAAPNVWPARFEYMNQRKESTSME